jgi:hypothetical protein
MKINGLAFLTTISRNIQYRTTAEWIMSLDMEAYRSALDHVLQVYKHTGLSVVKIHCNNEHHPLEDTLMDKYGISMNFASAQEHVPEAERNNGVIKEHFRATFH